MSKRRPRHWLLPLLLSASAGCPIELQGGSASAGEAAEQRSMAELMVAELERTCSCAGEVGSEAAEQTCLADAPDIEAWWTCAEPIFAADSDAAAALACEREALIALSTCAPRCDVLTACDDPDEIIGLDAVCDGVPDCSDASDEPAGCEPALETCGDGSAISAAWVCDGFVDCDDGSDERSCGDDCEVNAIALLGTCFDMFPDAALEAVTETCG